MPQCYTMQPFFPRSPCLEIIQRGTPQQNLCSVFIIQQVLYVWVRFSKFTLYITSKYFKATIDGHAFIIGRYITIMIVCNILIPIASKIWLFCIVHTNLSIKGKKKCFLLQNCPCVMVGAKIGYVLGPLVHGKVVVEFDRKVLFVDCLL